MKDADEVKQMDYANMGSAFFNALDFIAGMTFPQQLGYVSMMEKYGYDF